MQQHQIISAVLGCALALGCGSSESDPAVGDSSPDATPTADFFDSGPNTPTPDATRQVATMLPNWQLEDIQPESNGFGQTYGLGTFANEVIVVVLVEGF